MFNNTNFNCVHWSHDPTATDQWPHRKARTSDPSFDLLAPIQRLLFWKSLFGLPTYYLTYNVSNTVRQTNLCTIYHHVLVIYHTSENYVYDITHNFNVHKTANNLCTRMKIIKRNRLIGTLWIKISIKIPHHNMQSHWKFSQVRWFWIRQNLKK